MEGFIFDMTGIRLALQNFKMQMGPLAWHNFRCDLAASVLFSLFNVVFNQFYIPMAIRQGATDLQVGILAAAPAIGLLFSPLWASWIQRTSPKPFTIYPNLIGRALILLPALFGAPLVYVAAALMFHLLMGIQAPAYAALVSRMYPPRQRGRLMGNVRVAMGLLMIPLAYLVGFWTDAAGPGWPLALASLTGVLSILIFTRVREAEPSAAPSVSAKRMSLKAQWDLVRGNRTLMIFFIATTLAGFGNLLANPLYQIIQVDRLALTDVQIGVARVVYYACLLTTYYVIGWAIDRFSAGRTIVYGVAAYAVVPMLYALAPGYPTVLIGSGVQGIGDAIWDIGILAFVNSIAPGREAVVFGLHLMLFGIRGTAGPLLGTSLSGSVPLSWLLIGASVCGWLGTLTLLAGSRGKTRALRATPGVRRLDA
jgi:MFS family permease